MRKVVFSICFILCLTLRASSQEENPWREDGRCGTKYPLSDEVTPGQCDPLGDGPRKGPCCSNRGFCGNSRKHCKCRGCQDFSKLVGVLYPAGVRQEKKSPLTLSEVNRTGILGSLISQQQTDDFFNSLWGILSEPINYVSDVWYDNKKELPEKVSDYVERVASNGAQLFETLYNDTKKDVFEEAIAKSADDLTKVLESFIGKIEGVYLSADKVVNQKRPLSDEEIKSRKVESNLEGTKADLDNLRNILPLEKNENKKLEGLEGLLQNLITSAREIISLLDGQADLAWSKLKQLEVEFYQASSVLANTTGEVRETLKKAFEELNKQMAVASPALRNILQGITNQTLWNGTIEAPRSS